MEAQLKSVAFEAKAYDEKNPLPVKISDPVNPDRVIRFRASDDTLDRTNEVIVQDGWDFSDFQNNPVVMAFHNYNAWPIGKAVGVGVVDNALYIDAEFDPAEIDGEAEKVFRKIKHGSVNAGSVGFIPQEFSTPEDAKAKDLFQKYPGARRIYTKQQLLEWTICPVPCNQNALAAAFDKAALDLKKRFGTETQPADTVSDSLLSAEEITQLSKKLDEILKR